MFRCVSILFVCISLSLFSACSISSKKNKEPTIKIGILHSFHGLFADNEIPIVNATILALEEINETGGLLGYKLEACLGDGQSHFCEFEKEAERLIDEGAVVLFGGFTSESRKAIKEVVERKKSLLFYPMHYEGFESSPNIIYMGSLPNQGVVPTIVWAFHNMGKRFAILSYDSMYSLSLDTLIKDIIGYLGGEIVCERFFKRNNSSYQGFIEELNEKQVDVIFSTQGTYLSQIFFESLEKAPEKVKKLPIFMFNLASLYNLDLIRGCYTANTYYEQEPLAGSHRFIKAYRKRFGSKDLINDAMVSAYLGVHLWAKAVAQGGGTDIKCVLDNIGNQSIDGPFGPIYIYQNHHTFRRAYVNHIDENGEIKTLWNSQLAIMPEPYPQFRSIKEWSSLMKKLEQQYFNCNLDKLKTH